MNKLFLPVHENKELLLYAHPVPIEMKYWVYLAVWQITAVGWFKTVKIFLVVSVIWKNREM